MGKTNISTDPDQIYRAAQPAQPAQPTQPTQSAQHQFTFFFYDLETSGLSPREDRIMQFAGQRTDQDLQPIGEPVNLLIKLPDDTLPNPGAIMVTKITPQSTQVDGLTEAEFCQFLETKIFTPNTCAIGFNSVRFDDEFIRHLFWRNFRDPYEWQWKDGRSRWDILDLVRITRALRPEGINWPTTEDGRATNRLELITELNGIEHTHAHDALSDIEATIAVAKLIKQKQPELYNYLFKMRNKKSVQALVNLENKKPFVYTSGRYSAEHDKTTVAFPLAPGRNGNILVFDLRYNLDDLLTKKTSAEPGSKSSGPASPRSYYPIVKELAYNKCPAIAPLGVLDNADGWQKIHLSPQTIEKNLQSLLSHPEFAEQMRDFYETKPEWPAAIDPESALYNAFLPDKDRYLCAKIAHYSAEQLADLHPEFIDERLPDLLLHYKAKNYPTALSEDETRQWEQYRSARLARQATNFIAEIQKYQELINSGALDAKGNPYDQFVIDELMLWYQSLQSFDY